MIENLLTNQSVEWNPTNMQMYLTRGIPFLFREPAACMLKPWGILLNVNGRHFQILVLDWGADAEG